MSADPMLPLPASVLARLRTAESLRAELAGITAERDALRTELDTAGWERDTAQNEAAWLRDEVLDKGGWNTLAPGHRVGLLLTAGDQPPESMEGDANAQDIAIVSLANGDLYVRAYPRSDCEWSKFGDGLSSADFVSLAERGPWVTVEAPSMAAHRRTVEAQRALSRALYDSQPHYRFDWPEGCESVLERTRKAFEVLNRDVPAVISSLSLLAGVVRSEWQSARQRAEKLTEIIAGLPHEPEWAAPHDNDTICVLCHVRRDEHDFIGAAS